MLVFSNDFLNPPFKSFALIKWRIKRQSCQCQSSVCNTKTLSWQSPDQAQSYLRLQIGWVYPVYQNIVVSNCRPCCLQGKTMKERDHFLYKNMVNAPECGKLHLHLKKKLGGEPPDPPPKYVPPPLSQACLRPSALRHRHAR